MHDLACSVALCTVLQPICPAQPEDKALNRRRLLLPSHAGECGLSEEEQEQCQILVSDVIKRKMYLDGACVILVEGRVVLRGLGARPAVVRIAVVDAAVP